MRAIDQIAGPAELSTGAREALNLPMHNSIAARIVSPAPFVIMSVVVVLFTIPVMLFITPIDVLPVVMVDTASQGGYQKSQKYIPSTVHGTLLVERSNRGSNCFESRTQSAELRARAVSASMEVAQ
ncbi:hypothetical protein D9M68_504300 [compost metagenome]|uniref:hypothetical protein n=1 Tax=Cupriavidus necator TaxID=106590 RepID=UPI0028B9C589